ncbi:TolC family protein [Roseovarius ramblicola]|uniref:TolC family protein n=1 Tax=Roseovarius ramblicola TaxID=2022336 RepID=A0ABV5I056_9RHOB
MRAALAIMALGVLVACTERPDLTQVQRSLAPGTAGLQGDRVPDGLATDPFGLAIARAVVTNPDLARNAADIRAARANQKAVDGAFRPDLNVGISAESRLVGSDSDSNTSPFLRVSQLVYDAGAAHADQTGAEARVLESRARQLEVASSVALETVETYQRLITSRRLLDLANENLRVLRGFDRQIRERVRSGAGSTADSLTARSRVADAETRRVDAQARLDRAEAAFRRLFQEPPGNLPRPVTAPPLPADETDVLEQSPRLRSVTAALRAAEADLSAARARRLPALELGATGRRDSGGGADVGLDLTLNYSLDTRGELRAAIDAAEARLDATRAERDMLLRDVREALAFVRADQVAGDARVIAARKAADTNAQSVDTAREQFSIGRRSMVDLLDSQRDYVRAEETLILAEEERFLTDYAALALTGDIIDVFAIPLPEVAP